MLYTCDCSVSELPHLSNITLHRHIDVHAYRDIQLLGISDVSQWGYAATVYLRVVNSLGIIQVYFIFRRGIPSNIYCDNGTNNVGAAHQIKALFIEHLFLIAVTTRVFYQWHFNPPAAPHFGELWEAAIKSTKNHFKHTLGTQILTYEKLHTIFTRIEGVLNSRPKPLTPLSSNPHDLCGHFLIG